MSESVSARHMRSQIGATIREVRLAMGWSQCELGRRASLSQAEVSKIERATINDLSFETTGQLMDALRVRMTLDLRAPFISDRRRQRDAGHAKCVAYVVRRLRRAGWLVVTEVEIVSGSARGWIDILAFRPSDRALLVIEVKTEIEDLGAVQRQLGWYSREAWSVARQQGWRPAFVTPVLLVLASMRNAERIADNSTLLRQEFVLPVAALIAHVDSDSGGKQARGLRALALIDPRERARKWLLRSPIERHAATPRYADYAEFMRGGRIR